MTRLTSMDYSAVSRTANSTLSGEHTWTRTLLRKVPEVTGVFWVAVVLSATVSEAVGNVISSRLVLGLAAATAIVSLAWVVVLIWQLSTGRYVPGPFWLAVVLAGLAGPLLSANLVDGLGVTQRAAATILLVALLGIFLAWYLSESTISVHTVVTRRRELWYWTAVLLTFALGTSTGDLVSGGPALGPVAAAVCFSTAIGLVTVAFCRFRMNAALAFWSAYVLTVPLGASIGDLFTAAPRDGGLHVSTRGTTFLSVLVTLAVIAWLAARAHRGDHAGKSD